MLVDDRWNISEGAGLEIRRKRSISSRQNVRGALTWPTDNRLDFFPTHPRVPILMPPAQGSPSRRDTARSEDEPVV
jgi:hypothetical protein